MNSINPLMPTLWNTIKINILVVDYDYIGPKYYKNGNSKYLLPTGAIWH